MTSTKSYSSAAARSFKTFVGELTAVAAGLYVGIQEVVPVVEAAGTTDPWKDTAQKHGVIVDGLTSKKVVQSAARFNVVSLYSGFDLFLEDVRLAYFRLHGKQWAQHDGDAPFQALARNTASDPDAHVENLGKHRIAAMDHYRLVRNAVAHPSKDALEKTRAFYMENFTLLDHARKGYGMQTAPNGIDELTFHDVKLLARLGLDLVDAIDVELDPGDERLFKLLKIDPTDRGKSVQRRRSTLVSQLRTDYGVSQERAERIVEKYLVL